jgi:hypothetical protein
MKDERSLPQQQAARELTEWRLFYFRRGDPTAQQQGSRRGEKKGKN